MTTPKAMSKYNFTTNLSGGGVLTEAFLNEQIDALRKDKSWTKSPEVWLSSRQLNLIKKRHPEAFNKAHKCSWSYLYDALYGVKP